jgi:hypothetical protein
VVVLPLLAASVVAVMRWGSPVLIAR